jgi:hypothetical protein
MAEPTREGYCYQHVQAITIAIDQYAENALGNRLSQQALRRWLNLYKSLISGCYAWSNRGNPPKPPARVRNPPISTRRVSA